MLFTLLVTLPVPQSSECHCRMDTNTLALLYQRPLSKLSLDLHILLQLPSLFFGVSWEDILEIDFSPRAAQQPAVWASGSWWPCLCAWWDGGYWKGLRETWPAVLQRKGAEQPESLQLLLTVLGCLQVCPPMLSHSFYTPVSESQVIISLAGKRRVPHCVL